MNKWWLAVILILTLWLCASDLAAGERGPSTEEERNRAIELTRMLEADPLGPNAKEARQWLILWLVEVPDIKVRACGRLLGPATDDKPKYRSLLFTQMIFSSGAFIIENPKRAKKRAAVYEAGLLGSLRAYEAILREEPDARIEYLDELISKRKAGKLSSYVRKQMKKCL